MKGTPAGTPLVTTPGHFSDDTFRFLQGLERSTSTPLGVPEQSIRGVSGVISVGRLIRVNAPGAVTLRVAAWGIEDIGTVLTICNINPGYRSILLQAPTGCTISIQDAISPNSPVTLGTNITLTGDNYFIYTFLVVSETLLLAITPQSSGI